MSAGSAVAVARAQPGQGVGEQVRAELRRAAAALGELGEADRRQVVEAGDGRHRPIIGPLAGRATISVPRERRGPGGFPGLQNRWRGARRRAVGSTPMRSRHRHAYSVPSKRQRVAPPGSDERTP